MRLRANLSLVVLFQLVILKEQDLYDVLQVSVLVLVLVQFLSDPCHQEIHLLL